MARIGDQTPRGDFMRVLEDNLRAKQEQPGFGKAKVDALLVDVLARGDVDKNFDLSMGEQLNYLTRLFMAAGPSKAGGGLADPMTVAKEFDVADKHVNIQNAKDLFSAWLATVGDDGWTKSAAGDNELASVLNPKGQKRATSVADQGMAAVLLAMTLSDRAADQRELKKLGLPQDVQKQLDGSWNDQVAQTLQLVQQVGTAFVTDPEIKGVVPNALSDQNTLLANWLIGQRTGAPMTVEDLAAKAIAHASRLADAAGASDAAKTAALEQAVSADFYSGVLAFADAGVQLACAEKRLAGAGASAESIALAIEKVYAPKLEQAASLVVVGVIEAVTLGALEAVQGALATLSPAQLQAVRQAAQKNPALAADLKKFGLGD